jgi:pimeloyl-ACP methyl ester carboxylesterase
MNMKIKVNDIELSYEKTGSGEALLLLHGNGEDHHIFDVIAAKLKNHFTVYAIDSRNHGESTKTDDYSYDTMAKDIAEFIRQLKIEKVNVLGFSDGAIVALLLATHSELIHKMALLGVNLKPEDFTAESYQYLLESYEETKDSLLKLMLEEPNIELSDVKKVTIPTLVVAAEHDIFKPESFVTLTNTLPNAELIIMNGHEHDSYIVNQDILYADLLKFFQ